MKRIRRDNLLKRTAAILGNNEGASLVLVAIIAIIVLTSVVALRVATTTFMASANRQYNQDQAYELAASLGESIDILISKGKYNIYDKDGTTPLLKTEKDYNEALKRIEQLFDAKEDTPEAEELELLSTLVELYEKEHFPIDAPDPVSAIKFRMEQEGLTNEDMVAYLGSKSKVSEVFAHKRNLSITMIRKLVTGLQIPAEVLLGTAVL